LKGKEVPKEEQEQHLIYVILSLDWMHLAQDRDHWGLLWTRWRTFRLRKRWRISWLAASRTYL